MIIPIDGRYRLKSDSSQWMLQKSKVVKGRTEWDSFKYFSNPSHAVTELVKMRVRESEVETLVDALAEVKKITHHVLSALYPHFDVQEKAS
jgi:hypothetical protein